MSEATTFTSENGFEPERLIGTDLVRATEAAALNAFKWIGKGDKIAADAAATDAIRGMLNLMDICATCTIGEGIKDEAPGIFVGEKLGTWKPGSPGLSIALDPIDGTTLTSKGLPGALAVLAAAKTKSPDELAMAAVPSVYMEKIAVGPKVAVGTGTIRMGAPVEQNLELIALKLGKRVRDLSVCILDRPRHEKLVAAVRRTGAAIRLIGDGDVAGAIAPSMPESGVDVYLGVGGAPEAVLAAAAIKCLGGDILARMWPRDDDEKRRLEEQGYGEQLRKTYVSQEMAQGDGILFVATGITDNAMLRGVRVDGHIATTHSIVMRARSGTVRYITAYHDLTRKTIRLSSEPMEIRL
ncbi:MAG: class II fructose-bisphosphatase [Planctomycetes bacterium]|nr:class II fructose-bisphosphatase [Planctomycetota bacterium]